MRIKYRKLNSRTDPVEFKAIYESQMTWRNRRNSLLGPLDAAAIAAVTAPKQVEGEDGEAELSSVEQMLRSGELSLTDLVDCGKGWTVIEQSVELSDVCEDLLARQRRASTAKMAGLVVLGMVLAVALAALFLWAHEPNSYR